MIESWTNGQKTTFFRKLTAKHGVCLRKTCLSMRCQQEPTRSVSPRQLNLSSSLLSLTPVESHRGFLLPRHRAAAIFRVIGAESRLPAHDGYLSLGRAAVRDNRHWVAPSSRRTNVRETFPSAHTETLSCTWPFVRCCCWLLSGNSRESLFDESRLSKCDAYLSRGVVLVRGFCCRVAAVSRWGRCS